MLADLPQFLRSSESELYREEALGTVETNNQDTACLRKPWLQDTAFLENVKSWNPLAMQFRLWWLGQSGFLIGYRNDFVLIDPYLSDSLTHKYAGTSKPHVRLMERAVDPLLLNFISLTIATHEHTDHHDPETIRPLLTVNPSMQLMVPNAMQDLSIARTGIIPCNLLLADEGRTIRVGSFDITGIASAHESVEYNERGMCRYLGYILRFGNWTVYHSGDTIRYPGLDRALRRFEIDVAILPINGRDSTRGVAGNLRPDEAAQLARDVGARVAIPCHYDMFAFNTADPEEFRASCETYRQRYDILSVGGHMDSSEL